MPVRGQAQSAARRVAAYTTTPCSGSGWHDDAGSGAGGAGVSRGTGFTGAAAAARGAFREWRSMEC